ncbi:natural product biosynthesis luciferase-like monooxygenase domain-containing protein [Micromonospora sediminicola]|uniref:Natural product biosynthesis luciferase-like monooxygenase domain-containing protein n=1 Tax=Micromonospora sediminicola TaxID=946078 RepID=A0A1A9B996_9ACTN|nr:MupA/Atu3671 family FMN-dependent luciferase-like monooxygenase [Micromonospora sediminicola]SBT65713.1 natural product biosynthesis luciferase-like monooxygenase domain-containing protein [Micromonospora sediminicola]
MDFSLFFFADTGAGGADGYRLLLESARFADANGFSAVWTPERHFHSFGGQYPNPAVVGAALAAVTTRLGIRAGSVVAPLHHPVRIAEEWSVVDNLSGGRVGVSFASGWHAVDFVLRPENYPDRKNAMVESVETVRRLWRGEEVEFPDGAGEKSSIRVFPAPIQADLPIWITSAGSTDTFRAAGRLGAGLLTHLLGQGHDSLARNIAAYRAELTRTHGADARGHVALMLHTMIGTDRDEVRELVREPFSRYLGSSIDLVVKASSGLLPPGFDPSRLPERDRQLLVRHAFDRYFTTSGLFGTVADGVAVVERLRAVGVDEIACLVDFGVPHDDVLGSLRHLAELRGRTAAAERAAG